MNLADNMLHVSLAGRLDTISSPGLRVLLIMRKDLARGQEFCLLNMNDTVKEIIETIGFDMLLC